MKLLIIILVIMLIFNGLGFGGYIRSGVYASADELVFSVKDTPYNQTFSYWVEKWFDWFLSFPVSPRENFSSTVCSKNQNIDGEVWMLADAKSKGEIRECQVPAGKALLVQIVGSNCSTDEFETYPSDETLFKCAEWVLPEVTFSASIDGIEVMNTDNPGDKAKFYVEPFFTNLTYPQDNKYGATAGTFRGTEAGYFLFVKPLETGNHAVKFDEYVDKILPSGEHAQRISGVTYNLQIVNMTK